MPLLDAESRDDMLDTMPTYCAQCRCWVRKNYCRECDEFCTDEHTPGCPAATHVGHRGYDRHAPVLGDDLLGHEYEAGNGAYALNFAGARKFSRPDERPPWERPVRDTGSL